MLAPLTLLAREEIQVKGAAWDSLAIPLKVVPIYLDIENATPVRSVEIEMEVYVKGELKRTIILGKLGQEKDLPSASVQAAIYFRPAEGGKVDGTVVMTWHGMRMVAPFTSTEEEIPMHGAQGMGAFSGKLAVPGRSPIFKAMFGGRGGLTGADDPQEVIRLNPESTVIIGYLKTE
ncbi:MAG: hypothetical protein BGO12_21795 [Verrucomicrobia bacterium 61-8]|nr:MAG: hypothetical protein BGO12_21795 [Verrucomicrobia bacterium 61-8]